VRPALLCGTVSHAASVIACCLVRVYSRLLSAVTDACTLWHLAVAAQYTFFAAERQFTKLFIMQLMPPVLLRQQGALSTHMTGLVVILAVLNG